MKNTILTKSELELLEAVVLRHGRIVTFEQIAEVVGDSTSRGALRYRVAKMSKAGWLIRLKRGVYLVVTDISTLGFADVSPLVIAQALNETSYISFESALQYHGLFDQLLARIDSVTTLTTKSYRVLETTYVFSKIQPDYYFGFRSEQVQEQAVTIAQQEKAILDILYFRSSAYAASLVLEKLEDYRDDFDFDRLKAYSRCYSLGMVRKVGFLLDHVGVDTTDLATEEVKNNSYTKLTTTADQFNAKWRLYHDSIFTHQTSPPTN
jgi:predicted transcriptional regulator of viral defense system